MFYKNLIFIIESNNTHSIKLLHSTNRYKFFFDFLTK